MCFWQSFLENAFKHLVNTGHKLDHIAEMNFITIAKKLDMSYDFHIRHNMFSVEWTLNALIKKILI